MVSFDVFISYKWNIKKQVVALHNHISKDNGYSTWRDDDQIIPAHILFQEIAKGITNSKVMIACITKDYSQSINCIREICFAAYQRKTIIPLIFEDVTMADLGAVGFLITPLLYINLFEKNKWYFKILY